ncbi:hypothetical protein LSTR_LSTR003846 [Laodelphax striatellus]|uniref:MADF domain-containing protein n=1 Tax=Laodelphax striatellus TaxID=195883 RepID=A0A482XEG4_LAOST|nr:hypothetical protein LSTR_LSTR003846 [Laodelphax striatellus]
MEGESYDMNNWTNEMSREFMELYEKHPCLWHLGHKDKKNRIAVTKAWMQIQSDFGVDVPLEVLRRKKESILATYRSLKRRIKQEKRSGNSYKPNWYLFPLVHRIMKNAHSSTGDVFEDLQHTDVDENTFADEGNDSEWVAIENDGQSMELRGSVLEVDGIEHKDESSNQPLEFQILNRKSSIGNRSGKRRKDSRKRKRANVIIETDDTNSDSYVLPEEIIPTNSAEAFDTCSMYCQLLAEKLRSMSSRNRIIVQNKIDNLVFKALMEELDAPGSQEKSSSLTAKESDVAVAGSRQKEIPDFSPDPLAIVTSVSNMDEQILSSFEEEHHTVNN